MESTTDLGRRHEMLCNGKTFGYAAVRTGEEQALLAQRAASMRRLGTEEGKQHVGEEVTKKRKRIRWLDVRWLDEGCNVRHYV